MKHATVSRIGQWVHSLRYEDIPGRVIEKARAQFLSAIGSIYAGGLLEEASAVARAVRRWDRGRDATVIWTGSTHSVRWAVFANTAMSMALDYDDYLFMGHSGHSAVLVPLAIGEALDLSFKDVFTAQVAANEIAGRLGASAVIGPLNGQMFSFIHLLSSSCSAAKLYGLEADQMEHALAIALAHPCYPLEPGFFNAGSKLLTAAMPCLNGLCAVELARAGLSGPLDILDHPRGFYRVFSYYPLRGMWTGLGQSWVSDTISIKIHPGCAYISAAMDALEKVLEQIKAAKGRRADPDEVVSVEVRTSLLGVEMEQLSSQYVYGGRITPVNVTFSLTYSLAIALLQGFYGAEALTHTYLCEHESRIKSIARRIHVVPDMELNRYLVRTLVREAGFATALAGIRGKELLYLLVQVVRNYHPGMWIIEKKTRTSGNEVRSGWPRLRGKAAMSAVLSAVRLMAQRARRRGQSYELAGRDLEKFAFPFAAQVVVHLKDGSSYKAAQMIPIGAAGGDTHTIGSCAQEKFVREAKRILSSEQIEKALSLLLREQPHEVPVRKLVPLITPKKVSK